MLGYAASMVAPELLTSTDDTQRILPSLMLTATPVWVQVMFFGALLSAIMSTASGTLLAPAALFMENILRPALPAMSDRKALFLTRGSVVGFFLIIVAFVSYKYYHEEARIFEMVENAYKITLAGAFVPLAMAIIHKRVHTISALLSMIVGIGVWVSFEFYLGFEEIYSMPPHFFAFLMAIIGYYAGTLLYAWVGRGKLSE